MWTLKLRLSLQRPSVTRLEPSHEALKRRLGSSQDKHQQLSMSTTCSTIAIVHVEPPLPGHKRKTMAESRSRRIFGDEIRPDFRDGVEDVKVIYRTYNRSISAMNVELAVPRCEAVAASRCRRCASGWCGEFLVICLKKL